MTRVFRVLFLLATGLQAAEISAGHSTASPGKAVSVPINLRLDGASITILQFDLFYDGSAMTIGGTIGPAGSGAGKSIAVSDLNKDRKRVVLFGVNREKLADGVVLRLNIELKANAPVREYPIQIREVVATDADAAAVTIKGVDGKLTVRGGQ